MNYHTSKSLEGHILEVGDIFGLCSIGHLVDVNFIENLGGCGNIWAFYRLGIEYPLDFLAKYNADGRLFIDEDTLFFKDGGLSDLTRMVIYLMELSENEGYDDDFDENRNEDIDDDY